MDTSRSDKRLRNIPRGEFHRATFSPLHVIDAYEDWKDCGRLALRMEWQTRLGLRSTYLQRIKAINKDLEAPISYIDTSAILAALKGFIYINPTA